MKANGERCHGRVSGVCTGAAQHIHHRKLRSQGGDNSEANLLPLCLPCHTWAHHNPAAGYEMGLLVHGWDDPSEVPVTRQRPRTERELIR